MALARAVIKVATGTGIHGGGQHETGRESQRHGGSGDADGSIFERLSVLQQSPATFRIANVQISDPLTKIPTPKPLSNERLSSLCRKGISTKAETKSASSHMVTEGLVTGDVAAMP